MRSGLQSAMVALLLGCSTTSTISRVNGPDVEGAIVGGSKESVFVSSEGRGEYELRRADITSIDYPGNVHTAIGAGVLVYGGLNIALGMPQCSNATDNKAAACVGVFLPALVGASIMTWGLIVNQGQKSAAADTSRVSTPRDTSSPGLYPAWSSGHPAKKKAPEEETDDDEETDEPTAAPGAGAAAAPAAAPTSSAGAPAAAPPAAPSAAPPAAPAPPAPPPLAPPPAAAPPKAAPAPPAAQKPAPAAPPAAPKPAPPPPAPAPQVPSKGFPVDK